jgi:RNA polymerase sigma factor (sigma-70 family)
MTLAGGIDTLTLHPDRPRVNTASDDRFAMTGPGTAGVALIDTASLTASLAAGDEAAVDSFYRRYFDLLFRAARRATGRDEAFCLDVVQESVLRVIRSARRTESEAAWTAWLRLVVRTTAYDLLRAESRRQRREKRVGASFKGEAVFQAGHQPCDAAEDRERRLAWLREQIVRLDPQIARAIDLRYNQQWKLARVAAALGLSIGTLDGRLRRALDRLRRQARRDWEDDDHD